MPKTLDLVSEFPGITIVHQKISGHEVGDHQHDEHEIFLPLQGEISIQAGERLLKAGPGKMVYLPPRTLHSFRSGRTGSGERLICIVSSRAWAGFYAPPKVCSVPQLAKELLFHLLLHPKTKAARALVETLVQTTQETLEGSEIEIAHLHSDDPRLQKALKKIENEYAAPLSIEELAKQSGLSSRNLNRLFLKELGLTPKQIITRHRIEAAKNLLRSRMVTDVALEVGYSSVSQFIHSFRKLTGKLPSEFQRGS